MLRKHRRALVEVLLASAAINLLMLATPLGFRLLLDTARQRNIGSLVSIAAVMLLAALGVGLIRTLRSYIFTETANRIDQEAKTLILDQRVRLPQGFFDSRPVGQVTFYFNQLDRLREFLIGQSLPLRIDTLFSLLYVAILLSISPLLTLVVLSTLPLVVALTLLSNPLVYSRSSVRWRNPCERMLTSRSDHGYSNNQIPNLRPKPMGISIATPFWARVQLRITRETISNLGAFIGQLNGVGDRCGHLAGD